MQFSATVAAGTLKDGRKRQFRSKQERRQIVEETFKAGASVSLVARAYDVNANQSFFRNFVIVGLPSGASEARHLHTTFRLGLALIMISRALIAHAQIEPKLQRLDFTPLVGWRTSITFKGQPGVDGVKPRLVLDASPSYGMAFGARIDEENLVEFRWARQNTHVRVQDAVLTSPKQDVILDQFHGDFTREYIIDDWSARVRPFMMASVGVTHVAGNMNSSFTRFSFGIGAGMKIFASRHLGFRVQLEWLPVVADPQVTFICGGGCIVHLSAQLSSQGEFTIGPLLRF